MVWTCFVLSHADPDPLLLVDHSAAVFASDYSSCWRCATYVDGRLWEHRFPVYLWSALSLRTPLANLALTFWLYLLYICLWTARYMNLSLLESSSTRSPGIMAWICDTMSSMLSTCLATSLTRIPTTVLFWSSIRAASLIYCKPSSIPLPTALNSPL